MDTEKWIEVIPGIGGGRVESEPMVSIRPNAIAFNAQFVLRNRLSEMGHVKLFLWPSSRQIGIKFLKDTQPLTYRLSSDGGSNRNARAVQASKVMRDNRWVAAVANVRDPRQRRFIPKWQSADGLWVISLCPAFEIRVSDKSDIRSNIKGIYRYRRGDEVVYIGRGQVRSRANTPERRHWEFDRIEYSPLTDEADMIKWERYWIEAFIQKHGRRPLYNKNSGEKID